MDVRWSSFDDSCESVMDSPFGKSLFLCSISTEFYLTFKEKQAAGQYAVDLL
jgi:hypothetical protein